MLGTYLKVVEADNDAAIRVGVEPPYQVIDGPYDDRIAVMKKYLPTLL